MAKKPAGREALANFCEEPISGRIVSSRFQWLDWTTTVIGLFARTFFCVFVPNIDEKFIGSLTLGEPLRSRDDEHNFAFHLMRLIVCQQFGSTAATEFLKF